MQEVIVRPSRPDDGPIAALLRSLDDYLFAQYPPAEFGGEVNHILDLESLLQPSVTFVAAWQGDEALGCGAVRRMRDGEGTYGEIKRMFVAPGARGLRIGEKLLRSLEQAMRDEGTARLFLETGIRQPEAMRLYERNGWRVRGPFGDYADHPVSVFMEKTL